MGIALPPHPPRPSEVTGLQTRDAELFMESPSLQDGNVAQPAQKARSHT